uniref:FAD-I family protein n=1 Tax=Fusobacterium nucleatum subsp. polymorphum TaxID=76857 RepID=UPI00300B9113
MKNRILFGTMLALLLVGSVSFADDDADKKRLLEEYDKITKEKAVQVETVTTEVVGENGEVVVQASKKAEKDMTESERMDVEIQRIKTRILAINEKI